MYDLKSLPSLMIIYVTVQFSQNYYGIQYGESLKIKNRNTSDLATPFIYQKYTNK